MKPGKEQLKVIQQSIANPSNMKNFHFIFSILTVCVNEPWLGLNAVLEDGVGTWTSLSQAPLSSWVCRPLIRKLTFFALSWSECSLVRGKGRFATQARPRSVQKVRCSLCGDLTPLQPPNKQTSLKSSHPARVHLSAVSSCQSHGAQSLARCCYKEKQHSAAFPVVPVDWTQCLSV